MKTFLCKIWGWFAVMNLSSVAWWCKLVKIRVLKMSDYIHSAVHPANLVTACFSSIWCKALKIWICWNAQTHLKTCTELPTKQGAQSLEGKTSAGFLNLFWCFCINPINSQRKGLHSTCKQPALWTSPPEGGASELLWNSNFKTFYLVIF